MILYFTGTGNSRYTARKIGEILEDEVVSLNDYIKEDRKGEFHSEKPYVFVVPTYAWQIPKLVERFLLESRFTGSREAYFLLTCGDSVGNAGSYAEKLCQSLKLTYRGLMAIVMPENYIALFPVPDKEEAKRIIDKAQPIITKAADLIKDGKSFPQNNITAMDRFRSSTENWFFYKLLVKDKGFWVTDACISCGKCETLCPVNDVKIKDGRPVWKGDCTHCMACICCCPAEAIEYKKQSKGQPRYYLE